MMGGRAAEQLMLGTVSTGAVDDIQRATQLTRRMVTEFGMSEALGSVRYAGQRLQYLGSAIDEGDGSAATRELIDAEVRRIIGEQFERATLLLAAHRDALERLSRDLLSTESLDGSAVRDVLPRLAQTAAS
jgi:cell division protease FtsH